MTDETRPDQDAAVRAGATGVGGAIVRRPGHPTVRCAPVCGPGGAEATAYLPGEAGPEAFRTCSREGCGRLSVPCSDDGRCEVHS